MDTRFFMPPDSSAGLARSVPARPTSASFSATIRAISAAPQTRCSFSQSPTFSPTDSELKRADD